MFPISSLEARDVRLIRIERGTGPATVLERKDGLWNLAAPVEAPADRFQVDRILAIVSARSPQRMAPTELARFELDPPSLIVKFDEQTLSFGTVNPVTREQYVLTDGTVYVIEPRYATAVPVDPLQLIQRRILPDDAVIARLELPEFTLARGAAGWTMTPPREGTSQDDLNRLTGDWLLATATRATQATARHALATIRITLKDGATIALDVVQRDPSLVLRHPNFKLEYVFTEASTRRLLSAPGDAPGRY